MTAPRMPSSLRKEEQAAWRRIVEDVGPESLERADRALLWTMAMLEARLEDIRHELQARAASESDEDGRGYLWAKTARGGWTSNPLISQERETVKELRLLWERLAKVLAARRGAAKPVTLTDMRKRLRVANEG